MMCGDVCDIIVCDVVCVVMLCDDVVMLCGDFMLFLDIDNGQTDRRTDGRTDICTSRVAFATENLSFPLGVVLQCCTTAYILK